MEKRNFGNTGLDVSRLTFGCGAVGGLMTKGDAADQDRAVAWARDNGINFFDTAASYGDGTSEANLGRALNGNTDGIVVSTKVGLGVDDLADVAGAVSRSLDASLTRLKLDHVDIFQLHNTLGRADRRGTLDVSQVLDDVIPAFEKLKDAGKTRFLGFTAKGEADDLHKLVKCGAFSSAQIFYNLLVPSAGAALPANYPADDFRQLLDVALDNGVGSIGVRVLAGGALSGSEARHPLGMQSVDPIGSETDYATDVQRARQFLPLVEAGHAASLPELAIRYVISNPALSTTEIGIATLEELQQATAAVNKGPLSDDALAQIKSVQAGFAA
ncbi:MAG: aldo/keto reductase [Rhodospirillaceae bacterium]|jgi:L-galactose dehydrogenase/L-glyceraldehyde 3-phosphate reductase|nr:aldo/keto reductase [Rhodospirillaceae bacterium]MBT5081276.1 aldo/keto reductase [Rhodospirillaceae bacterium]MBT5523720.1 aldo/keto reductase [Rhodospirillaceae bacterium]MBT5878311.1 aldo/keto reductase [Rhodospirillaceae bacterium]MBT6591838.1 aldo/keto reductase [Rhodospirillaceae bacterium]